MISQKILVKKIWFDHEKFRCSMKNLVGQVEIQNRLNFVCLSLFLSFILHFGIFLHIQSHMSRSINFPTCIHFLLSCFLVRKIFLALSKKLSFRIAQLFSRFLSQSKHAFCYQLSLNARDHEDMQIRHPIYYNRYKNTSIKLCEFLI